MMPAKKLWFHLEKSSVIVWERQNLNCSIFYAGESEASHRELVDFCQDFKFERMGCFAYSEEEGTPAASSQDQVSYLLPILHTRMLLH